MGDKFVNGEIPERLKSGESVEKIMLDDTFDKEFSKEYPEGRTGCRFVEVLMHGRNTTNLFKFFNVDGDPNKVKGFLKRTKLSIIKKQAIQKFISKRKMKNLTF